MEKCLWELQEVANPLLGLTRMELLLDLHLGLHCTWCTFSLALLWERGGPVGSNICSSRCRAPQAMTRLALAEPRCTCLPHKEISSFAFRLSFFSLPSRALSRGASPPAVP